jgi:hypothetical protein
MVGMQKQLDNINQRLDRIERRFDLVDVPPPSEASD